MNTIKTIQILPPELSNQIAAGEVVERPASVVKELVENSIDANARLIEVDLENGGQTLIRVTDNGCGIPENQLKLAVTRHATSKIASINDLLNISTFGFRGEALPSIASVSHFRITSAAATEEAPASAASIEIHFGEIKGIVPAALNRGTLIEVKNLLSNIPARLKFLKSPASELRKAEEIFTRIALVHTEITFIFRSGNKELLRYMAGETLLHRIGLIWPQSVVDSLIPFDFTTSGMHVHGYTSNPQSSQPRADRIFLYVNGRAVNDKILLRAVRQAYQGTLTTRDYPQAVLFLEIPASELDVNVHPSKNEVRFRDESLVFNAVYHAIHTTITSNLPDILSPGNRQKFDNSFSQNLTTRNENIPVNIPRQEIHEEDIPFILRDNRQCQETFFNDANPFSGIDSNSDYPYNKTLKKENAIRENKQENSSLSSMIPQEQEELPYVSNQVENEKGTALESNKKTIYVGEYLGQIAKNYLVFNHNEDSLLILDQHAIHERIFYERLKKEGLSSKSQSLLIPLNIPLHKTEISRFHEIKAKLVRLGFQTQLIGSSCHVNGIPQEMDRGTAAEFLQKIFSEQVDSPDNIWIHHACATAIRSGQKLSREDVLCLLEKWAETEEPDYCPHGRPCSVLLNKNDLEALFKRRQ